MTTEVTTQPLPTAGAIVTTWFAVFAALASNKPVNAKHIGDVLSLHTTQYYAAMKTFLGSAKDAP